MLFIKTSHILAISGLFFWQSLPFMIKYSDFYSCLKLFFLLLATPKKVSVITSKSLWSMLHKTHGEIRL